MDTETLVDELIVDGQKVAERLAAEGFTITTAFWLQAAEDGRWRFYVVSPLVDSDGLAKAYRKLHSVLRAMPGPRWIDPLGVKLISPENPIAKDVLDIHKRTPGLQICPIRWGGKRLGNVSVEGAYLYPLPSTVTV